ncbi:hypothetical protein ABZX85_50140 [Streptomyces sp. NPDC004539]|uniref:hypothetical protein n=1 Tax=Streptomyces sp. NPDC004539 TaxID=3154280 RepID=UPI0033B2C56E
MVDFWSLVGGLSLARMRPILEVSGDLHLVEIDGIVSGVGASEVPEGAEKVALLRNWRSGIGTLEDSSTPTYLQAVAAGVAILVVSKELPANDRDWRIRSGVGNFWDSCDELLHAGGGYAMAELKEIKTTLRGVENMWRDGDALLLSDREADSVEVYSQRLSLIRSKYPRRRKIARVVAECAGWNVA